MEKALAKQLGKKAKAVILNAAALKAGFDYAEATFTKQDPFAIEPMNETAGKILIEGNAAAAVGCMMAGVTVVAWYPITPSSSLCESLIGYMKKYRVDKETGKATFAIVQAEDEIASLGMVIGASWAGARSMTATAGPGISLMGEFAGLAYYAETPAVIFDVQRVGPSTGLPTRTAQGDMIQAAFLSHGDTKHIMLIPCSVEECYQMAQDAFELAEMFQTPIFVMMDLDLGMNNWMSDAFKYPTTPINRGKLLTPEKLKELGDGWGRYKDVDGDGIPYRTIPGDGMPSYFTRGSGHNAKGQYSERPDDYVENMDRLSRKFETARTHVPAPVVAAQPEGEDRLHRLRHLALRDRGEPRSAARRDQGRDLLLPAARVSVHAGAGQLHRRARARLRHRAEPRRPAAAADEAGDDAGSAEEAAQRAALQRPADRRPQHHRRCAGAGRLRSGEKDGRPHERGNGGWGIVMATPIKVNRIGLEPAIYKGGKTTLCAGCGHNAISERIIDAFYEMGIDPKQVDQAVGHRLLEQEPGLLPRRLARLQRRPRPHAVGRHRRDARQPQADRHRRSAATATPARSASASSCT